MAFKEYRFDVWRLWAAPANDAEAPPWVAKRGGRKACRKRVKRDLKALGLPRRLPEIAAQADVTRRFIVERCMQCRACPRLCDRLEIWRVRSGAMVRLQLR